MRLISLLFLLVLVITPAAAQEAVFPNKTGAITDHFEVISDQNKERIEALTDELRKVTSINLVMAVIKTTRPMEPEQYGRVLYEKWDVGRKEEGLDHGVLILLAVLDREVRLIVGGSLAFLFPAGAKQDMEMSLYPLLGQGKMDEAAYLATATVADYILREWPKYHTDGRRLDVRTVSQVFFILSAIAILLTLIYGGTFVTAFATIVGGIMGYMLLDIPGMLIAAVISFLLTMRQVERKMSDAEKELKDIYDKWKHKKKEEGEKRARKGQTGLDNEDKV